MTEHERKQNVKKPDHLRPLFYPTCVKAKTEIYIGGIFPNTGTKYVAPELAPGKGSSYGHIKPEVGGGP